MIDVLNDAIDPSQSDVVVFLTDHDSEASHQSLAGDFQTQILDIDDIKRYGDGDFATPAGTVAHEIAEQTEKQRNGITSKNGFECCHTAGIIAENAVNGSSRINRSSGLKRSGGSINGKPLYSGTLKQQYSRGGMIKTILNKVVNNNIQQQ